jgi:hypothetical protein
MISQALVSIFSSGRTELPHELDGVACLGLGIVQRVVVRAFTLQLRPWHEVLQGPVTAVVPEVPRWCLIQRAIEAAEDGVVEV